MVRDLTLASVSQISCEAESVDLLLTTHVGVWVNFTINVSCLTKATGSKCRSSVLNSLMSRGILARRRRAIAITADGRKSKHQE